MRLASAMASSSWLNLRMAATGPNGSSLKMRASNGTSASTVGIQKLPQGPETVSLFGLARWFLWRTPMLVDAIAEHRDELRKRFFPIALDDEIRNSLAQFMAHHTQQGLFSAVGFRCCREGFLQWLAQDRRLYLRRGLLWALFWRCLFGDFGNGLWLRRLSGQFNSERRWLLNRLRRTFDPATGIDQRCQFFLGRRVAKRLVDRVAASHCIALGIVATERFGQNMVYCGLVECEFVTAVKAPSALKHQ